MVYNLVVKLEADAEMFEAIYWYSSKNRKLGLRLAQELKTILQQIELHPEHFQNKYKNIRICFTKTFPYGIHYIIDEKTIFVIAIMHTSRKPTG